MTVKTDIPLLNAAKHIFGSIVTHAYRTGGDGAILRFNNGKCVKFSKAEWAGVGVVCEEMEEE